ncbi:MAG: hypothetical protein J7L80_01420 [Thermoplasmata archaeon]|nr:hypothetical protein [Thermoplasmata archaeon]
MNEKEIEVPVAINLKLSKSLIVLAGGIAILLVLIGILVMIAADSPSGDKLGAVLYDLGIIGLGGILYLGALTNDEIDTNVRASMIIGATILLAMGLIKGFISWGW